MAPWLSLVVAKAIPREYDTFPLDDSHVGRYEKDTTLDSKFGGFGGIFGPDATFMHWVLLPDHPTVHRSLWDVAIPYSICGSLPTFRAHCSSVDPYTS